MFNMSRSLLTKIVTVTACLGIIAQLGAQDMAEARAMLARGADGSAIKTVVRVIQQLDKDDFLVEAEGQHVILDLDKAVFRDLTLGGIYEVIGELERSGGEKYGVEVSYGIDALIIERRVAGTPVSISAMGEGVAAARVAANVEITPINQLRRGSFAAIQVEVEKILDKDEIRVRDETGGIRVDLGNTIVSSLRPGETLIIEGFVDNGPMSFIRREFYANHIRLQDGRSIEVRRNW